MPFEIQEVIKEGLASGLSVDEAYKHAANITSEQLYARVQTGESAFAVLREMKFAVDDEFRRLFHPSLAVDEPRLYVVISGGGVEDVPSATCMAEQLKDKPNPTHSDIDAAIAACQNKR
jgi:hypothetical protein